MAWTSARSTGDSPGRRAHRDERRRIRTSFFTWLAQQAPPERVGAGTGIVGAAGGLGGYFTPLVMGATYEKVFPGYGGSGWLCSSSSLRAPWFAYFGIKQRPRRTATV